MYILGINPGHDATACLIDGEGKVLAAVAEERVSRVKFDYGIPSLAIDECLRITKISHKDVGLIAVGFKQYVYPDTPHFNEIMLAREPAQYDYGHFHMSHKSRVQAVGKMLLLNVRTRMADRRPTGDYIREITEYTSETLKKVFLDIGFEDVEVVTVDHHLSHAAGAYYASGFDDPLIVTLDGSGDGLCGSMNIVDGDEIKRLSGADNACSPGTFYAEITHCLGFKRNRHEGKITGLAAYGSFEETLAPMKRCLGLVPDGTGFTYEIDPGSPLVRKLRTFLSLLRKDAIVNRHATLVREYVSKELDGVPREDIAAAAQQCLEESVDAYVANALRSFPRKRVIIAGGVFANVKLNQRIYEIPGVEEVFVYPNMGDGGVSYGSAVLALKDKYPQSVLASKALNDVYYGPEFSNDEVKEAIDRSGLEARYVEDVDLEVARYVAAKKIVGRFTGRMEYGPRALGNRSILADPTNKSINDWLNKRLKRTEFMPFAPSVLDRAAPKMYKDFEKGRYTSSFMTITFDVEKEWVERSSAVVHVDDTARPQVVSREHNPRYYRVLEEYEKLTGLPLFVNTSFNMHEEPILCTPEDALRSFQAGSVDVLAIENFILESDWQSNS